MPNTPELRLKTPDSEKITINLGHIDLGHVDLLVREGFYANRTDFIRTAIRNQLDRQNDAIRQAVIRHQYEVGMRIYTRQDLTEVVARDEVLHLHVLGLLIIEADVPAELARGAIGSLHLLGGLQASAAVKAALRDRLR